MSSDYNDTYRRVEELYKNASQAVANTGSQNALELRDMARQLSIEAEKGMPEAQLAQQADELERLFSQVHEEKNYSFREQPHPRPPLNRGEDMSGGHSHRQFYGTSQTWYKQDWK